MYVERLNKLGEEAQGASRHQYPYIKGAYGEDRARFSWSCTAEGQEAMVTSCSEGNLDQRHGKKKKIHARRRCGLSTLGDLQNLLEAALRNLT